MPLPRLLPAFILGTMLASLPFAAGAAPGDTTWVRTFDEEFINWATPHYATFSLPTEPSNWQNIVLFLTIGCPSAPGDCDPWDRLGHLRVVTPDQGDVEIARFITPYDITIGGGPGTCTWSHNCTSYKSLLHDEVELRLYIESWIGGDRGWLITLDFAFIEGELDPEPYEIVNLWQTDWVEYGNPDDPLADHVAPVALDIPVDVTKVQVRTYTTGHGQGNTYNAAEFYVQHPSLSVDGTEFSHQLWRSDCGSNSCSPQGGNWTPGRAGWCPGDRAIPWKVDITSALTPGTTALLSYGMDLYENLCRPGNPDCVAGVTCPDCNYNSTGHTTPIYVIQSHAVFYKPRASVVGVAAEDGSGWRTARRNGVRLGPNVPNPFRPETTFQYSLPRGGRVVIQVHDAAGRLRHEQVRHHDTAGTYSVTWNGRDREEHQVGAGVYFYTVRMDDEVVSRKMIRLR